MPHRVAQIETQWRKKTAQVNRTFAAENNKPKQTEYEEQQPHLRPHQHHKRDDV